MTDLTEREKQIVAWLRVRERLMKADLRIVIGYERDAVLAMLTATTAIRTSIEAGEPWKDQE